MKIKGKSRKVLIRKQNALKESGKNSIKLGYIKNYLKKQDAKNGLMRIAIP